MTAPRLPFPATTPADAAYVLGRAELAPRRPKALHGHDFYELFWVQNGTVRQHLPDGVETLTEGDLAFVRPDHVHALQGKGEAVFVVSIALRRDHVDALLARHPDLAGRAFWAGGSRPARVHRDPRQMAALNAAALRLERARPTTLELEAFLLPLLTDLAEDGPSLRDGAPDWLSTACIAARDPKVFRDGAAGFARVAGRAHPHVSRTARRYLGISPSDYVNAQRMAYAARRLAGSGDSLSEIAADCGIANLSHFHKLFRAHYGATPQKYRKAVQQDLIQPSL